jgi:hypothetical protein
VVFLVEQDIITATIQRRAVVLVWVEQVAIIFNWEDKKRCEVVLVVLVYLILLQVRVWVMVVVGVEDTQQIKQFKLRFTVVVVVHHITAVQLLTQQQELRIRVAVVVGQETKTLIRAVRVPGGSGVVMVRYKI